MLSFTLIVLQKPRAWWVSLVALVACGAERTGSIGAQREAIVGGTLDATDPAVVAIVFRRTRCEQTAPSLVCTGTLIAPRVVLTAAHCLVAVPQAFEVYFGAPLGADPKGAYVRVDDAVQDPDWDITARTHDAALFFLAEPAPVAAAAVRTGALDVALIGTEVRAVGFGVTDPAQPIVDGNKREGTMTVSALEPAVFRTTPGPTLTCNGDSGGPVFATGPRGEELIGISVSGDTACASFAKNTRIDAIWTSFVQPNLPAGDAIPVGDPPGALPIGGLCARTCKSAGDCPGDLACSRDFGAHAVCALPGLTVSADFGAACRTDAECGGGTCARIAPSGDAACRCAANCPATPTKPPTTPTATPSSGGGCSVTWGSPKETGSSIAGALTLVLGALVRRRRGASARAQRRS